MKKIIFSFLVSFALGSPALATAGHPRFEDQYKVKESVTDFHSISLSPAATLKEIWQGLSFPQELKENIYYLLQFEHLDEAYGDVDEPYNRENHFGNWIDDQRDDNCFNTRAKVLMRDSANEVTLNSSGCSVASGYWTDPYGGEDYTQAKDIQIDHFVPLKNAYISGADKWSHNKRCLYFNFMGNNFHLLPVYGKENSKKSDKTPEGYMPPEQNYRCQYLAQWLKVKLIWSLALTPPEKESIVNFAQSHRCDLSQMVFSEQELQDQRQYIEDNIELCSFAKSY